MVRHREEAVTERIASRGEHVGEKVRTEMSKEVLILSRRGPLCDSLQSVLVTVPWVEAVHMAEDLLSALRMVTQYRLALVIIVDDLPADGISIVLKRIRSEGASSRSLVLAKDSQQRQEALTLGADAALLRGFPAAKLLRVIERLVTKSPRPDGSDVPGMGKL
jgi:DNA-binding NarL/FixJ family response regulator